MQKGPKLTELVVQDAMRSEPIVVDANALLAEAVEQMDRHSIGCMPVVDGPTPVGMVTDRDILVRGCARHMPMNRTRVKEVMSTGLLTVLESDTLAAAEELMHDRGVRRLVVLDEAGGLAGLLSGHDLAYGRRSRPQGRQVSFYRCLLDSYGRPHKVETCRLYISPGVSAEAAEPLAIERFEQASGGHSWRSLAEGYEVSHA